MSEGKTKREGWEQRHVCGRLLFIVTPRGVELRCDRCNSFVLYSWRTLLKMMVDQVEIIIGD